MAQGRRGEEMVGESRRSGRKRCMREEGKVGGDEGEAEN